MAIKGEKAEGIIRELLTGLGYEFTVSQKDSVLSFASEKPDLEFTVDVHQDGDGNFQKASFESKTEVDLKKLEAVVSALSELFIGCLENAETDEAKPEDGKKDEEGSEDKPATENQDKEGDGSTNDA